MSLIHSDSIWGWQTPCYSSISDSAILQKHSWLKLIDSDSYLIQSDSSWWWQPSWILPSWTLAMMDSAIVEFPLKLTHTCQDWFPSFAQKHFSHTSLPTICTKDTLTQSLIPTICTKKLHSFILTQLDDGSHLGFCHLGFSYFAQNFDSN